MIALELVLAFASLTVAGCTYAGGTSKAWDSRHGRRDLPPNSSNAATEDFLSKFSLDDSNSYLTSDVGGPIEDQRSLSAGERGRLCLRIFIFRQKIQHSDHERVRYAFPDSRISLLMSWL